MRVTLNNLTGLYSIQDEPTAPKFHQFAAGIGYLDPKGADHYGRHWFVVIGENEGHEYIVITADWASDLTGLAKALTDWKDDLCIEKVYLDGTDMEARRYLSHGSGELSWDGLTGYQNAGEDRHGIEQWSHKPDTWPKFRDRKTVAHIIPVPDSIRVNLSAGYDLLIALERAMRLKYRPEGLMIQSIRREEKRDDVISHPLMRATIWTLSMLEHTRPGTGELRQPEPLYGNLRK